VNIFVTFQVFQKSNYASIYTVTIDDTDGDVNLSEYGKFLTCTKNDPSLKGDLSEIAAQIEKIVTEGISAELLRPEERAKAFPGKAYKIVSADFVPHEEGPLRLYCVLLPDNVMILCGGAQKSANEVKNCPNVKPHFRFANQLARGLEKRLDQEPKGIGYEEIERILEKESLQL
jgi:hypothetical protein